VDRTRLAGARSRTRSNHARPLLVGTTAHRMSRLRQRCPTLVPTSCRSSLVSGRRWLRLHSPHSRSTEERWPNAPSSAVWRFSWALTPASRVSCSPPPAGRARGRVGADAQAHRLPGRAAERREPGGPLAAQGSLRDPTQSHPCEPPKRLPEASDTQRARRSATPLAALARARRAHRVSVRRLPPAGHAAHGERRRRRHRPRSRHRRYENLFVSGGAVFPSMSPSHPTLTIVALAIRLGRSLAREASGAAVSGVGESPQGGVR
jgi:hypothetical protein